MDEIFLQNNSTGMKDKMKTIGIFAFLSFINLLTSVFNSFEKLMQTDNLLSYSVDDIDFIL